MPRWGRRGRRFWCRRFGGWGNWWTRGYWWRARYYWPGWWGTNFSGWGWWKWTGLTITPQQTQSQQTTPQSQWAPQYTPPQQYTPQSQNRFNLQMSSEDIKKRVKDILSSAILGEQYPGYPYYSIIWNGNVVGYLWEKVPLNKLEIGNVTYFNGQWHVSLTYKGKIVGYVWVW